jgi:5-methylcytosine-specific restriction protein A
MSTFLITWNRWHWTDVVEAVTRTAHSESYRNWWEVAAYKRVKTGDRVFMLKQGKGPRGLIASGTVISEPYTRAQ